ncbi:MAG: glycosyltransferase [Candidatus Hydrogenedentes bacterium]|nr:glycosyltransferase [Candidatus Hydrogenedentota bacterium]
MEFSGERCIPGRKGLELLELEHRARYAAVAARCAGGRVLDLGAGAGYGTDMLAASAAHVLGVDISEEAVSFATEAYGRGNARFVQADLCADDFADIVRAAHPEPFDAVTCFEVIEHVAQPQKLLRAVRSLLAPDGLFFVSTPNIDYAFDMEAVNPHHVIEYNLPEFERCLGAEFRHVAVTGQKVHLISTVGCADGDAVTFTDWRDYGDENHVKYYAAVCTNAATAPPPLRIALRTSDAHLKILQSKLREVRKDQEVKGQRIRLLEAHLAERKDAGEAARQDEVRLLREDLARTQGDLARTQEQLARMEEELREVHEDRKQFHESLRQARDMHLRIQEDLRRVEEEGTMGAVKRINQLRRDFEAFKNHPAVRRLLRLRTPGLKLLGLLGLGPGRIAPLAAGPSRPAPQPEVPEKREDPRPFDQLLQDRTLCRNGKDMPILGEKTVERLRGELMRRPQDTLVSVIMPAWNRAETIGRAVESVLAQSYANWELIVVDDGSDDGTPEAVQAFRAANPKIRLLRIAHEGVSAARDAGLREAKGGIIAYLDSDNRWLPDYLLFSVHALLETGAKCGYSVLEIVDEDQRNAVSHRARRFDLDALLKNNYIDINIYVHRRELFEELGGFDHTLRRWVDWDVILRQTTRHDPVQIPAALCVYYRKKKLNQITLEEPQAYKFKVLNKHLIDWEELERDAPDREAGRVSIIIPVYNLPDLTRACVESIHAHSGALDYEVVLVDNGSTMDASAALRALAEHPRVFLLTNYENYMFALGNNLGAAGSSGDILVFLNNDTRVTPGWLETLTAPLREDPSVGMAGPKLLYEDGTVQAAGMAFSDRSVIPYHIYQGMPGDAPCVNKRRTFQALTAACVALRAEDFLRLRGFDPLYVNGGEDLDLCFRVTQELNKRILYVPESTVYHLESKTPGRSKAIRHNRTTFFERWGEAVRPDDQTFFEADGFRVREYVKRGNDPDGPTASYIPVLETEGGERAWAPPAGASAPQAGLNVGFVCIWHVRGIALQTLQIMRTLETAGGFAAHALARWEADKFTEHPPVDHPRVMNGGDDPGPEECVAWARERRLDAVFFMEVHPRDWKRVDALQAAGFRVFAYENLDVLRLEFLDRYARFDGFFHNTFETGRVFRRTHPQVPSLVVPWGIPEALFPPAPPRPAAGGFLRFVHVAGWGGINNRKNTDGLLRAWAKANPANAVLRLHTQAPAEQYGPESARILRACRNIELREGTVENIHAAYADADMLLWPSKREGLGLPIVEALACGLPVLISDGYLMKQWVLPGEHGLVCPASPQEGMMYLPEMRVDEDALAAMIRDLAAHPERVAAMAENVRRDRHLWLWTWQPDVLAGQLRAWLEDPAAPPDPELGYLPESIRDFERKRRAAFGEQ